MEFGNKSALGRYISLLIRFFLAPESFPTTPDSFPRNLGSFPIGLGG